MATVATKLDRPWLWRSRAWISLLLLGPAMVMVAFSPLPWRIDSWAEYAMTTAGWILFLCGGVYRFWAALYIGERKAKSVIQEGPYSMCRHPLYFGSLLLTFSVGFLLQSWILIAAIGIVSLVYMTITLPREEKALLELFGEGYREYQQNVSQLIPNPWAYHSPEVIEVNIAGLRSEMKRAMRWVLIPGACHLMLHLRNQDWWPILNMWQ